MTEAAPAAAGPAPAVPGELLRLRPPRHRLERRSILWWTVSNLCKGLAVLGPLGLVYAFYAPSRPWLEPLLVLLGVVWVLQVSVAPSWRYYIHRWETSEEAVYSLRGWVVREWRFVPVSRIQSVDTVRGPLQQLFGLATLRVTTASKQGRIKISGLDAEIAERLAHELTELTQATPGDAT
ncbi:PH domain-containing protein [Streptomyces sp. NPDC003077]|uniref:PH domain-containing protein n=1 Tax=Streptomyces sp. NPDC003077 TaxID=3154443 RepID=UPI0033AA3394